MKRILIFVLVACCYLASQAQNKLKPIRAAIQAIQQNIPSINTQEETTIREPKDDMKGNDNVTAATQQNKNDIVALKDNSAQKRVGISADGVSRVVVICRSDVSLIFSVPSEKDGLFSTLDNQTNRLKQITAAPFDVTGKKYVVVIFYAPDSYGLSNLLTPQGRDIKITITNATKTTDKEDLPFKIYTPPVVLVHGVWSNAQVWQEGGFEARLRALSFTNITSINYTNFETFSFTNSSVVIPSGPTELRQGCITGRKIYRDQKIAVTQVDVVAHSLGGLVSRAYINSLLNIESTNYFKGNIHKLITLGTPHNGSALCDTLWKIKDTRVHLHDHPWLSDHFDVAWLFARKGKKIESAVRDLRFHNAAGISLGATKVKAHSIAGDYQPPVGNANNAYKDWNDFIVELNPLPLGSSPILIENHLNKILGDNHDCIVGVLSALGGLAGNFINIYQSTVHSQFLNDIDVTVYNSLTNSVVIQNRVYVLLLSDDPSLFAATFPSPSALRLSDEDISNPSELQPFQNVSSNLSQLDTLTKDDYIEIVSPVEASIYNSSSDSVILEFRAVGVARPAGGFFMVGKRMFQVPKNPPYKIAVKLKDYPTGKVDIIAVTRDTSHAFAGDSASLINGALLGASSFMFIQNNEPISNFSVNPPALYFDSLYAHASLSTSGNIISDTSTFFLDLSHVQTGTTYKARKGIVQIDNNGTVTALKIGLDTIEVRNGPASITVPVDVSSLCSVPKPTITVVGDMFTSSSSTNNHWFVDGSLIDGATGNTYNPPDRGFYSVQVTQACSSSMSDVVRFKNGLLVSAKAFLQGNYNSGLMNDELRAKALLPTVDPYYTIGFRVANAHQTIETISIGLLDSTGNTAISDWVWLELRDSIDPKQVITTRSALILRNGNIVDLDGFSPVRFYDMPDGHYYIALRHRNHLGVMAASPIALSNATSTTINFTSPSTATYGTEAQNNVNGVMVMWAGNANTNSESKYQGPGNDRAAILTALNNDELKTIVRYSLSDFNMDGQVKYQGPGNDRAFLLSSVLGTNELTVRKEQLPQ